jgi:hypothetical protein
MGNVGENTIIWIYLVKLFYKKVTCLFIAKYIYFMICDRITHILTEFHRKEKKLIWGDVCVRKIIKHWWQVKIEKSQTPSGKISIVLWFGNSANLVRERLQSYPGVSEISRSWPVTGVRLYYSFYFLYATVTFMIIQYFQSTIVHMGNHYD